MATALVDAVNHAHTTSDMVLVRSIGPDYCTGRMRDPGTPPPAAEAYARRPEYDTIFNSYQAIRNAQVPVVTATGNAHVVDNRPGQGGSLALGVLAKSPPDGSVAMLAHMSAVATNPHLYKSGPYDSLRDFDAVGLVGDLPFVMVCNPALPVRNVAELVAYAKANPTALTNASSGNGTVSHLAMEEFKRQASISIRHVPYKGSVQAGKLRALAAGPTKRLSGVLDVPTLAELGYHGINAITWLMLLYPAGTPKPLIASSFEAINNIMRMPDVIARLTSLGLLPRSSASPDEAQAYLRSEFASWGVVVKRSGTTLD